ncbi:MAG TPA: PEP-CTERM sorting domain-containing protein [Accumulibacter sp.]|jgi:hypothetical protein|nr:PEP-CTERM sorting domain-containing protein [Accumulibacter sp.]HPP46087.1 PEP-CTERM sorting domain-containing protein [Accumulibacter sp.]
MRKLLSAAVLMMASLSASAAPVLNVPEPESLALVAVAGLAMLVVKRRQK